MVEAIGNAITIKGTREASFFRYKYLSIEEVKLYTALGELTQEILNAFSVAPVTIKGSQKYLKAEIDSMMLKYTTGQ